MFSSAPPLRPKYPLALSLRLLRKDAEQFSLFGGAEQVPQTKQARQQQRLKEKWGQQGELFSLDTYSAPKVTPKGTKKPLKPKQQGQQPKVGDRKYEGGVSYVFNRNYRWQRADKGPVDTTPKAAPAAPQGLAVLRDDDQPVTVKPAAPVQAGYAVPEPPSASAAIADRLQRQVGDVLDVHDMGGVVHVKHGNSHIVHIKPGVNETDGENAAHSYADNLRGQSEPAAEVLTPVSKPTIHDERLSDLVALVNEATAPPKGVTRATLKAGIALLSDGLKKGDKQAQKWVSEWAELPANEAAYRVHAIAKLDRDVTRIADKNKRQSELLGAEATAIAAGKDQLKGQAEKNVGKLIERLGLSGDIFKADDYHVRLKNEPYQDLVIEKHGDRLYLTHYYEQNGDQVMDTEMVYQVHDNGQLRFLETAVQHPHGGESRRPDRQFAGIFSRNLLHQGFDKPDAIEGENAPAAAAPDPVPLRPKQAEPEPAIAPTSEHEIPLDQFKGKGWTPSLSVKAFDGDNPLWFSQQDLGDLSARANISFQGEPPNLGSQKLWAAVKAAMADGFKPEYYKAGKYSGVRVLVRDGNALTAQGLTDLYGGPTREDYQKPGVRAGVGEVSPEGDRTPEPIAAPESLRSEDLPTAPDPAPPEEPSFGPEEEPSIDVDADYASVRQEKQRLETNEKVKVLLARGGPFTEPELTTLAQYSGGGGLGANTTSSNEYYTRADVANLCTDLLYQHGFKGGAVLEPACGAGVYLHQFKNDPKVLPVGVELSDTSSGCAAALNPHASVTQGRFERFLIDNPDAQFEAVTGNIPFGPRDASGSTSEKKDFEAATYKRDQWKNAEGLFLTESMDRLKPSGTMSIVVPHGVTTGKSNQLLREKLAKQGRVLGVLRLPGDAFAHTGTKTVTDILVMQKHPDAVLDAIARGDQDVINAVADHTFVGGGYFEANPDHILGEAKMKDRGTWGKTLVVDGSTEAALRKAKEVAFSPAVDYAGINAAPTDLNEAKEGDTKFVGGIMYRLEGRPLRWHLIGRPGESEPMATDPEAYGVSTLAEAEEKLGDPGRRATIHPDHLPNYLRMAAGSLPESEVGGFRAAIASLDHAKTPAEREKFSHAVLLASHLRDVQQREASDLELKQALGMLQEYRDKYGNPSSDRRLSAIALDHPQVLTLQGAFDEAGKISDYFAGTLNTEGRQFSDAAAAATEAYRANSGRAVELDQVREFYDSDLSDDDLRAQVLADPAIGYSRGQFMPINQLVRGDGFALLRSFEEQLESAVEDSPEARKLQAQIELTRSKMDTRPIDAIAVSLWNVGSFIPVEALNEFLADTGYDLNLEPDPDKPGRFKATNINLEDKDVWKNHSGLKKDKTRLGIYWEVNGDKYNSSLTATPGLKLSKAIANVEGEFKDWLIGSRYASEVEDSYNQAFNSQILAEYDGSPMEIAGIDQRDGKRFHDYQFSTIRQMADQGRGIVSLGVGLGKTATAIGLSQHLKQLGRAKKPGIVVPKSVLSNWVKEIKFWSPNANLMILGMSQVYWKDGTEAYELPGFQLAMQGEKPMTFKGGEPQLKLIGDMAGYKLKTTGTGAAQVYARDEAGNYLAYDEEDEDVPAAKRDYTAIAADQLDSVSTPLYGGGAGLPQKDGNGNFVVYADSDRRRESPISLTEGQLKKDGILAMSTDDRATKERKMQQTSQNNFDIVLMSEPVCQRINVSPERYGEYIEGAVGKHLNPDSGATKGMVTAAAQRLAAADDGPEEGEVKEGAEGLLEFRDGRWRRLEGEDDLKRGYAKIKQQEQVTGKMLDRNLERTTNIYWEDLGIDALIGDEAHHYKNLWAPFRSESDIAFVSSAVSKRSMDWFFKCQYTRESNNGQNTYLLTATPTTNNPLEAYNMLQHVCPDELEARGIHNIDHFLDHFGRIEEISTLNFALDATTKKGLVGFENLNDLRKMFKQYCRMESAKSLKAKGNTTFSQPEEAATIHTIEMSPKQKATYEQLRDRAKEMIEAMKRGDEREEGDDHVFSIISDMDKAALDINYYEETRSEHSQSAELETDSDRRSPKIEGCASQVMASHTANQGKQIVFCDSVQMHESIRQKLIAAGYPAEQIAICNASTMPSPNDRQRLSTAYNSGQITLVIGNTATMGEGMNFNIGTTDIHHLNQPWTPAAVEQRNGRGIRQGNKLDEVRTHYYVSDGSFDAYRQDTNARKANWIDDLWNGTEDSSENLETTGDDMAILLGDGADVLERIKASKEAAAQKKIREGKAAAMRGFKALQQQKARYQKMTPEERAGEDGVRLSKDIERTVKRLASDPHFELKGLLDSPDPAYIHGDGTILAVGQHIQDHQSWGSKIYRVTGVDLAKKKITAVEAAGGDRDPDSFDPGQVHEMPLSLFASTSAEVQTKQNAMKGRGYEKRQAQGKVIRPVEYNDDLHRERIISKKGYDGLRSLPPEWIDANRDKVSDLLKDGRATVIVQKADGSFAKNYAWGGSGDEGDRLVLPSDGAAIDSMLRAYAKGNVEGKREYSLGNYINELLGGGAAYKPEIVAKINGYEAEFKAMAEQGPKEGDRKTEGGVEYELRGGRWHRVGGDEPAAGGGATAPTSVQELLAKHPGLTVESLSTGGRGGVGQIFKLNGVTIGSIQPSVGTGSISEIDRKVQAIKANPAAEENVRAIVESIPELSPSEALKNVLVNRVITHAGSSPEGIDPDAIEDMVFKVLARAHEVGYIDQLSYDRKKAIADELISKISPQVQTPVSTTEPAAATLNTTGLSLPSTIPQAVQDALADTKVALRMGDMGIEVPEGHIVMNASRPLPGHQTGEGDFMHGRFYSFIDPTQPDALRLIENAKSLDGWVAIAGDEAAVKGLALKDIQSKSPEYSAMYDRLKERSPERADRVLVESLQNLKGKTFGEISAYLTQPAEQTPVSTPAARIPESAVDAALAAALPSAGMNAVARERIKDRVMDAIAEMGHEDHTEKNEAAIRVAVARTIRTAVNVGHMKPVDENAIADQVVAALASAPAAAPADGSGGKSAGWRAMADQLSGSKADRVEQAILTTKKEGWVGNTMKEREVRRAIAEALGRGDAEMVNPEEVDAAFEVAKQHYAGAGAPAAAAVAAPRELTGKDVPQLLADKDYEGLAHAVGIEYTYGDPANSVLSYNQGAHLLIGNAIGINESRTKKIIDRYKELANITYKGRPNDFTLGKLVQAIEDVGIPKDKQVAPTAAAAEPHPDPTGAIVSAYQALFNNDQDGASEQNGVGFNGMHTPYRYVGGMQTVNNEFVAGMIERIENGDPLTPNQHTASLKVLNTYRKQLEKHGVTLPTMEELEAAVAALPAPAPKRGPDRPRDTWTRQDYAKEVVAALKETADDHGFDPNIWDRKGAMRIYLNTNGPKTGPGYIDIHDDGTISNQTSLPDEHPVFSIAAGAANGFKQPERAKLDSKTPPTRAQFAQYLEQELNAHPDTALKASVWTGGRHVRVYLNEPDMDRKKGGRGYIDVTPAGIVNKTELSHTSSTYQVAKQIADQVLGQHGSLQKSAKIYTILGVPYVLRGIGRAVKLTKFTSPFSDALLTV